MNSYIMICIGIVIFNEAFIDFFFSHVVFSRSLFSGRQFSFLSIFCIQNLNQLEFHGNWFFCYLKTSCHSQRFLLLSFSEFQKRQFLGWGCIHLLLLIGIISSACLPWLFSDSVKQCIFGWGCFLRKLLHVNASDLHSLVPNV